MRVWLDDERPMPPGFDVHVKTSKDAIALLATGNVQSISLDHDLGADCESDNGMRVAEFIERSAFDGSLKRISVSVHSMNPVGSRNMKMAVRNAINYWRGTEEKQKLNLVAIPENDDINGLPGTATPGSSDPKPLRR